jgi:calcium-dependent protein kinase
VLKLIDFGMAQLVESGWAYKGRIGTLYFMAPEIYDRHFPKHITDKVLKAADVWSMGVMLYLMLTGTEPFQEEHGKIIYTNITWPELPVLSESCKDLVSSMLALDFAERMHPWIDKSENNASRSLGVVVESLQDFSASKLMKKVVIGLLQKDASPDDETELQEVFEELDIDGDQRLDLTELTTYLHQHGFESKDEAEEIAKDLIDSFPDCKAVWFLKITCFVQYFSHSICTRLV